MSNDRTPHAATVASTADRSEKEKMLAGELYHAGDAELQQLLWAAKRWMSVYNAADTFISPAANRLALLRQQLGSVGDGVVIRPPFFVDYGFNLQVGRDVFLNYNCVILDVCAVRIGDGTAIGPAVQILTADHPRDPAVRATGAEFGRPVTIGKNVWIGAGALVLPGVTVGDDAIVGAGAVVTKDVPKGATVVGNPARVLPKKDQMTQEETAQTQ